MQSISKLELYRINQKSIGTYPPAGIHNIHKLSRLFSFLGDGVAGIQLLLGICWRKFSV
ncbi:MAG: hypothetical protein ACI89U_000246 [Gammaproteobacteria bacterium]|jgi:hypothetical protein